ncbi:MAG: hypothetical protein LBN94_03190 [Puniceicoccales bacterium]|jgi:hypothetical protein|nr:hypothetical protein [Puniceicoccales bacterium]
MNENIKKILGGVLLLMTPLLTNAWDCVTFPTYDDEGNLMGSSLKKGLINPGEAQAISGTGTILIQNRASQAALEAALEQQAALKIALEEQIKALEDEIANKKKKIPALGKEIAALKIQMENLDWKAKNSKGLDLKKEIAALEDEIVALEDEIAALKDERAALWRQKEDLEMQVQGVDRHTMQTRKQAAEQEKQAAAQAVWDWSVKSDIFWLYEVYNNKYDKTSTKVSYLLPDVPLFMPIEKLKISDPKNNKDGVLKPYGDVLCCGYLDQPGIDDTENTNQKVYESIVFYRYAKGPRCLFIAPAAKHHEVLGTNEGKEYSYAIYQLINANLGLVKSGKSKTMNLNEMEGKALSGLVSQKWAKSRLSIFSSFEEYELPKIEIPQTKRNAIFATNIQIKGQKGRKDHVFDTYHVFLNKEWTGFLESALFGKNEGLLDGMKDCNTTVYSDMVSLCGKLVGIGKENEEIDYAFDRIRESLSKKNHPGYVKYLQFRKHVYENPAVSPRLERALALLKEREKEGRGLIRNGKPKQTFYDLLGRELRTEGILGGKKGKGDEKITLRKVCQGPDDRQPKQREIPSPPPKKRSASVGGSSVVKLPGRGSRTKKVPTAKNPQSPLLPTADVTPPVSPRPRVTFQESPKADVTPRVSPRRRVAFEADPKSPKADSELPVSPLLRSVSTTGTPQSPHLSSVNKGDQDPVVVSSTSADMQVSAVMPVQPMTMEERLNAKKQAMKRINEEREKALRQAAERAQKVGDSLQRPRKP